MKSILTTIAFLALAVSGLAQTRSVIVNTSGVVQSPTNFWSANVTNAFSGLGLGTAATNAASAFQPSSLVLSNLSSSNGGELTNLTASNITGIVSISNGGSSATTAGGARTNLGLGVTNNVRFNRVVAPYFQSTSSNAIIELDDNQFILTAAQAEFRQPIFFNNTTNASATRTNLGGTTVGNSVFTATNAAAAATAVGLGATNEVTFGSVRSSGLSVSIGTNDYFYAADDMVEVYVPMTIYGTYGISFATNVAAAQTRTNLGLGATNAPTFSNIQLGLFGSGSSGGFAGRNSGGLFELYGTNLTAAQPAFYGWSGFANTAFPAGTARTNLELGATWLTNTNVTNFRTAIGLSASDSPAFFGAYLSDSLIINGTNPTSISATNTSVRLDGASGLSFLGSSAVNLAAVTRTNLGLGATWLTNTNVTNFRTAINLGWSALTNANTAGFNASAYGSGTNPVLYNTNGEVVSPTNFWQVAPIVTRFVEFLPSTNATTNITAARNLHIHSLALSITGVTSTINLPTTDSFNGDIALVVHQGPTSSVTEVTTGSGYTTLATMNKFEEAIEFVYYNGTWQFNHNQSFVEPIFFSGDNAAVHAAESRTNLGIPLAALTNTNNADFQAAIFNTNSAPTNGANVNAVNFNTAIRWMEVNVVTNGVTNNFRIPLFK